MLVREFKKWLADNNVSDDSKLCIHLSRHSILELIDESGVQTLIPVQDKIIEVSCVVQNNDLVTLISTTNMNN